MRCSQDENNFRRIDAGDQRDFPAKRYIHGESLETLGPAIASRPANLAPVIRAPPGSGHTIYDTFDDEKRVI
jgi:hypothetical protein